MKTKIIIPILLILITAACGAQNTGGQTPAPSSLEAATTNANIPVTETFTAIPPTETFTPIPTLTFTVTPAPTDTPTSIPVVESLKATVTGGKLSCRYGPGAEYLYLFAFNEAVNVKLVGRTDANNWVWVANKNSKNKDNNCWVNAKYLNIDGDPKMLPIVYPDIALLPVSPYYPVGPSWVEATRSGNAVVIKWEAVPISPGKYADDNMKQYLAEIWRCEAGQIIFETLGTNSPTVTVKNDEAGCSEPSHGRVFVQEKHGYSSWIEISWPKQ